MLLDADTIKCSTDGSRMMGRMGSGLVAYFGNEEWFSDSVSLGEWATVFQAENHALISLANSLISRELHGPAINKFIDSQAALLALESGCHYYGLQSCYPEAGGCGQYCQNHLGSRPHRSAWKRKSR